MNCSLQCKSSFVPSKPPCVFIWLRNRFLLRLCFKEVTPPKKLTKEGKKIKQKWREILKLYCHIEINKYKERKRKVENRSQKQMSYNSNSVLKFWPHTTLQTAIAGLSIAKFLFEIALIQDYLFRLVLGNLNPMFILCMPSLNLLMYQTF